MNILICIVFLIALVLGDEYDKSVEEGPVLYDAYFGKPISEKRQNYLTSIVNGTSLCTVLVQPCRKDEGRRIDGTCSNPYHPSRGASMTPLPRLLPPQYGPGNSLRPARDGFPLPSTRVLRTSLLSDGLVRSHRFSALSTAIFVSTVGDSTDLFYTTRYAIVSDCCLNNQIPNDIKPLCIPITIPRDDPFLRRTGIRCMNLTRVEMFQEYGCIPQSLPADRFSRVTPLLDLSPVYGYTEERSRAVRANQGGLLAFTMEGDREVPAGRSILCFKNMPPETSCYNYGDEFSSNLLQSGAITVLWFFREHNRLARKLAEMNPCWDDQKLFETARKINIAQWQYIFYYELIPEIIGYKNAVNEGIIFETDGYINDFHRSAEPGVYREYVVGTRWFHTMQPGTSDLYRNGKYLGSRTVADDELRSGIFALNNTEADLTEGYLRQPADAIDYVIDTDMSQRVFGEYQAVSDLPAIDMMRGRDAGFQNYNAYRKLCGYKPAKKFEHFYDTIPKDQVEKLKRLYEDVEDVELMVAIYIEKLLPGTYVGPTLYCIMVRNLRLWRKADKFFFEHGDFPAALSLDQLNEVRKTSIARILCDNGDRVKYIQPHAFLRKGPWNDFVPCEHIREMELIAWKDKSCPANKEEKKTNKDQTENNVNFDDIIGLN